MHMYTSMLLLGREASQQGWCSAEQKQATATRRSAGVDTTHRSQRQPCPASIPRLRTTCLTIPTAVGVVSIDETRETRQHCLETPTYLHGHELSGRTSSYGESQMRCAHTSSYLDIFRTNHSLSIGNAQSTQEITGHKPGTRRDTKNSSRSVVIIGRTGRIGMPG